MNVYIVHLSEAVAIDAPYFGGKAASHLYVTATSFEKALEAVRQKYPQATVRSVSLQNYASPPILAGE